MKSICKINFHPLFYIVTIISIFTGNFHDFFLFVLIIVFHELGHIISGILLKWKIKRINILPFGAITIFDEGLNKPIKEELIVAVMGPVFQIVIYNLLKKNYDIKLLHYSLLFFNLLPLVPLDGSKILNSLLNYIFSFKNSFQITMFISLFSIVGLILFCVYKNFNLVFLLIIFFLLLRLLNEIKDRNYIIRKFLYDRYIYHRVLKHNRIIIGEYPDKIHKEYNYLFKVNNIYYTEHEILRKMFDFKGKL